MYITLNNNRMEFTDGQTILELLNDKDRKYMLCKVNGELKELKIKLTKQHNGAVIETLGLNTSEGIRAYESSLRFMIAMAFKRLYPDASIRFTYYVSRSIFCEVIKGDVPQSHLSTIISDELKKIVLEDLPFERTRITTKEATDIYLKDNMEDKIEALSYKPESVVHMYNCDGYHNYLHYYMVPSTGYIKDFLIRPFAPGIIIQYPRRELDLQIPEFEEETNYGRTLKKAYKWAKQIECPTVYELNKKIEQNYNEFIQVCETKHNNMLHELGLRIKNDIENIRLIAIAGPSSSGKTTFCNRLKTELLSQGIKPVMISIDDYYLTKPEIAKIQGCTKDTCDLEHINCLDLELFNQHIFDLINGDEIQIPKFDFTTGKRVPGKKLRVDKNSPIIIEGIHALNEKLTSSIPKYQKFKIFIAPAIQFNLDNHSPISNTDLRLIRRIVRDKQFRNCPGAETIQMWDSVRQGEFKWIYHFEEDADFVYNSELSYELSVLRNYALPELKAIPVDHPSYLVANRLIRYLKYFKPIQDESKIPCNSLIREFIGGSCFNVN